MENYIKINRQAWDAKVEPHLKSEFYGVADFLKGKSSLNSIEMAFLNDIREKQVLHLQCHFGQDSISLSRLGAKVTAVDFSEKAIEAANRLKEICGTDTAFMVSDIYELPECLNQKFDMVFTSYGTIGWLPDLERWAQVISHFLKPGGQLVFVEFHPFIWMYDEDFTFLQYSYFNEEAIIETEEGTYAEKSAELTQKTVTWNHPVSEVLNALIGQGIEITSFNEYNYSPYSCFSHHKEISPGKYIIPQLGEKVPHVYALTGNKKPAESI